jgi:hypothetical protein
MDVGVLCVGVEGVYGGRNKKNVRSRRQTEPFLLCICYFWVDATVEALVIATFLAPSLTRSWKGMESIPESSVRHITSMKVPV